MRQITGVRLTPDQLDSHSYAIMDLLSESMIGVSIGFRTEGELSEDVFEVLALESRRMRDCLATPRNYRDTVSSETHTAPE